MSYRGYKIVLLFVGLLHVINALSLTERIQSSIQEEEVLSTTSSEWEWSAPLRNLKANALVYETVLMTEGNICGINISRPNPDFDKVMNELVVPFNEPERPYCDVVLEVVPVICKLKSMCVDKNRANDFDLLFAFFYAYSQYSHYNHMDPFICKGKGKELSGQIISHYAYTTCFNYKIHPFLARDLPCNTH